MSRSAAENPPIDIEASADSVVLGWAPRATSLILVDLIHRLGAERVEFGLHQVPHRVAVRRNTPRRLSRTRQTKHLGPEC